MLCTPRARRFVLCLTYTCGLVPIQSMPAACCSRKISLCFVCRHGKRTPVRLSIQGPAGEAPATAPFSNPLHQWYRRWMGGVSRPHSFFLLRYVSDLCHVCPSVKQKARHQAQHTCSRALRHRYRLASPEAHLLLIVLFGLRQRGFEPPSSEQQPAALPLRYLPQKPTYAFQVIGTKCPD